MNKRVLILLPLILLGFEAFNSSPIMAQTQGATGNVRLFLCLDNSKSMKGYGYYESVINHLRRQKQYEVHYIAFGNPGEIAYFRGSAKMMKYLRENTSKRTDFKTLFEFLIGNESNVKAGRDRLPTLTKNDIVAILSDGVHDREALNSLNHFTMYEVEDLLKIRTLRGQLESPIWAIQVLGANAEAAFIEWRDFSAGVANKELIFARPVYVAGISKSFMKMLAGKDGRHEVYAKKDGVFKFFSQLTGTEMEGCTPPVETIPIKVLFQGVPAPDRLRLRNLLKGNEICVGQYAYRLRLVASPANQKMARNIFELEVESGARDSFSMSLSGELFWEDGDLEEPEDFLVELGDVLNRLIRSQDRYSEYRNRPCYLNFRVENRLFLPLIQPEKIVLITQTCDGFKNVQPTAVRPGDWSIEPRIYVKAPLNTKEIHFFLGEGENQCRQSLTIKPKDFNTWEQDRLLSFQCPMIRKDFYSFVQENKGDLIIYSSNNHFVGNVLFNKSGDTHVDFFPGLKYVFYFVPQGDRALIRLEKQIDSLEDLEEVLPQINLNASPGFNEWKGPLAQWNHLRDAANNDRQKLLRQIVKSNTLLYFLMNLGETKDTKLIDILKSATDEGFFKATAYPFPFVFLLRDPDSPYGPILHKRIQENMELVSDHARERLEAALDILENPEEMFDKLIRYLNGDLKNVDKDTQFLIQTLFGDER